MELEEFPKGTKYREQTDIVKIHTQKHFIVLNANDIFCCGCKQTALLSHREVVGKKLAGPCLKAFQGYLPPWETRNTREAIYIGTDTAYQDQLELGLSLSQSTEKEPTFTS